MTLKQHDDAIARLQREVAFATGQLLDAMKRWEAVAPPLSVDLDSPPPAWDERYHDLAMEVSRAWRGFALKRANYDGVIKERAFLYPDAPPL